MISSKAVSNSIGVDYTNENKVTWSRWNSMEIFKIFIVKAEMELQLARFSNSEELKIYTTKDHGFELHIYNASAQLLKTLFSIQSNILLKLGSKTK